MKRIITNLKMLYIKGAFHIILGTFATKFVAFFGSIFVVRLLSKQDYGLVGYVENIYSYALVFAGFGLSNAILRYVVISDKEKKGYYFHYVVKRSVLINVVISLIIIIANTFISYPDGFSEAKYLIPIISLLLPFQDLVNDGLYSLRALFMNKQFAYCSLIISLALILGRCLGAYSAGALGVISSRVIINAIFGLILLYLVKKTFVRGSASPLSKEERKDVNIYSVQYMITNGLWMLFMLNDVFILGLFCSNPEIVADYKVAYVLPGNISIFSNAIAIFISPYFTRHENDCSWVRKNYKRIYLFTALAVAVIVAVIYVFAEPLIVFLYGEVYVNILPLMRILLIAAFFNAGLRYMTSNLLAAMGQVKYNMVVSAIGMVAQIILDVLLVQWFQSIGIAMASCVVYLGMAVASLLIFYKKYYISK